MFRVLTPGLFHTVGPPRFGRQDLGISPAGCMDRFAFDTGNLLLDNPQDHPALEMIIAPKLAFEFQACFVLTGARHQQVKLKTPTSVQDVFHGRVHFAPKESEISFGPMAYGFRSYLCWRTIEGPEKNDLEGRERGDFNRICQWPAPDGAIRVVKGPEHRFVKNPQALFSQPWHIAGDSNRMGLRLLHTTRPMTIEMDNMISAPVSDGTVQLPPEGPIVLLRHRQTIGGYPRIFNTVSADVDLLAQYMPGQIIRFKMVTIEQARAIARQKHTDLQAIRERYSPPNVA